MADPEFSPCFCSRYRMNSTSISVGTGQREKRVDAEEQTSTTDTDFFILNISKTVEKFSNGGLSSDDASQRSLLRNDMTHNESKKKERLSARRALNKAD